MITQMYTFSPGSFVVADEWNANFNVLYKTSSEHAQAISDAYDETAFPNSDLSNVFAAVNNEFNSFKIEGDSASVSVTVGVNQEFYKTLASGQKLVIEFPQGGLDGESRILLRLQENRYSLPFSVSPTYSGTTIINHYNNYVFRPGYYYIMIYETNNVAQLKLIWTGV